MCVVTKEEIISKVPNALSELINNPKKFGPYFSSATKGLGHMVINGVHAEIQLTMTVDPDEWTDEEYAIEVYGEGD